METRGDKDPARVLRQRIRQTMGQHNRRDVEITFLLRDWENQWDDDLDAVEDFKAWCRRRAWKVGPWRHGAAIHHHKMSGYRIPVATTKARCHIRSILKGSNYGVDSN